MTATSKIILIISLGLFVFLAVLVVFTIIRTYRLNKDREKIEHYIAHNIDLWYDYLYYGNKPPETQRHSKLHQRAIEKIFSTFLSNGKTKDVERRISSYARMSFSNEYRNDLKSPLWAKRINALHKIAEFKVPGFTNIYSKREIAGMTHFEFSLYLIYMSIYDFERFRKSFIYDRELSEYENKKVLSRLDDAAILSLIPAFQEMSLTTKYAFLNRVARVSYDQPVAWLESLFEDDDRETRIRALKTIQSIGLVNDPEKYTAHFTSIVWEERMLVSRLAPFIGEETVPLLKLCASDKNKLVQNAALNSLKYFEFSEPGWSVDTNMYQSDMKEVPELRWN